MSRGCSNRKRRSTAGGGAEEEVGIIDTWKLQGGALGLGDVAVRGCLLVSLSLLVPEKGGCDLDLQEK